MRIYALIEDGAVFNIVLPWTDNGVPVDLPIEERFPPEVVAKMVEITDMDPMPQERWLYADGVFSPPPGPPEQTLGELKEYTRGILRGNCSTDIERTSFPSSALGAIHNYDCRLVDQINLKMRYDIALSGDASEPVWASDGTRFEWKNHTAEELLEVMISMNDNIKLKQQKLATKMAAVDAATTKSQVEAVHWE